MKKGKAPGQSDAFCQAWRQRASLAIITAALYVSAEASLLLLP
ncbi:hypothetical protein [Sodalis praecaptivus]|nr:hypothetical protein [Sodalis praecaptivus]